MPESLAKASRAGGRKVYLPVSNNTSPKFTTNPRTVSRVSRMRLRILSLLGRLRSLLASLLFLEHGCFTLRIGLSTSLGFLRCRYFCLQLLTLSFRAAL